jgi:hypothetical protein
MDVTTRMRRLDAARSPGRLDRLMVLAPAVAFAAAVVLALVRGTPPSAPSPPAAPPVEAAEPSNVLAAVPAAPSLPLTSYRNTHGGYALRYPSGWRLRGRGGTTTITAPGRQGLVSVAPTEARSPRGAVDAVMASLRSSYRNVEMGVSRRDRLASRSALALSGEATNRRHERLRFLIVGVDGRRAWALTAFIAADAEPSALAPGIQAVIDTFRPR